MLAIPFPLKYGTLPGNVTLRKGVIDLLRTHYNAGSGALQLSRRIKTMAQHRPDPNRPDPTGSLPPPPLAPEKDAGRALQKYQA